MTIIIEAGKIQDCGNGDEFRRWIQINDSSLDTPIVSRAIYAKTKDELEIIDHENFFEADDLDINRHVKENMRGNKILEVENETPNR